MKVSLNLITEIKITDLVKTTIENLTKNRAINSQPLLWVNGYLFFIIEYEHDDLTLEATKGILNLDTVMYAESPLIEYSKFNGFSCDVLDCSGIRTYEKMMDSIKDLSDNG